MRSEEVGTVFRQVIQETLLEQHEFDGASRRALDRVIEFAARNAEDDERISSEVDARYFAQVFVDSFLIHAGGADGGEVAALVVDSQAFQAAMLSLCPVWPWCR